MAYVEAIAHGLPVIGMTGGAIPEAVPAGAGVLVPPGDVTALAAALRRMIERPTNASSCRGRAGARRASCRVGPRRRRQFSRAIEAGDQIARPAPDPCGAVKSQSNRTSPSS